jgi:hypothetical protein
MSRVFIFLALLLASAAAWQTEDESCNLLAKEKKCRYFQYDPKTYEAKCKADTDCSFTSGKCDLSATHDAKDMPDDDKALGVVGPLVGKCNANKNETSCKAASCSWVGSQMCGPAKTCCFPTSTTVKEAFTKANATKAISIQYETDVKYAYGECGLKMTKADCDPTKVEKCTWDDNKSFCVLKDEIYLTMFKSVCPKADWEPAAKNMGWTGGMAEIENKYAASVGISVSGAKTSFSALFAAAVAAVALLLA